MRSAQLLGGSGSAMTVATPAVSWAESPRALPARQPAVHLYTLHGCCGGSSCSPP